MHRLDGMKIPFNLNHYISIKRDIRIYRNEEEFVCIFHVESSDRLMRLVPVFYK